MMGNIYDISEGFDINSPVNITKNGKVLNIKQVVEELRKLQAENEELRKLRVGISVNDDLPEEGEIVALYGGDIDVLGLKATAGYYDKQYGYFKALLEEDELELCNVATWIPLPVPLKEKNDD